MLHYSISETKNITENNNNNEADDLSKNYCSSNEDNSHASNIVERCVKISVNAEIYDEPRKKNIERNRNDSNTYKNIVMQHNIVDEDEIVVTPEDKPINVNTPSSAKFSDEGIYAFIQNSSETFPNL